MGVKGALNSPFTSSMLLDDEMLDALRREPK
jgi:hypothetical protein